MGSRGSNRTKQGQKRVKQGQTGSNKVQQDTDSNIPTFRPVVQLNIFGTAKPSTFLKALKLPKTSISPLLFASYSDGSLFTYASSKELLKILL